jgi:protein-disulfide isomerase
MKAVRGHAQNGPARRTILCSTHHRKGQPMKRRHFLSGAAAIIVAAASLFAGFSPATAQSKPDVNLEELNKTGELPDNVIGNANAPVTIIEYSSMTCPHCAAFHKEVLPALKSKYIDTGKVKYIVREFPLDNVAATASMLARCVEPAKYLDFVDLLYSRQQDWAFKDQPLPELQKFAKQVGFTEDRFNSCIRDEKVLKHIEWVRDRGNKQFGVRATPSFFVNGKRIKGAATIEKFDELIAAEAKS